MSGRRARGKARLSDYEVLRLENIKRNQTMMKSLGLGEQSIVTATGGGPSEPPPKTKKRKAPAKTPRMPTRRSARNMGKSVDYTEEVLIRDMQLNSKGKADEEYIFSESDTDPENEQAARERSSKKSPPVKAAPEAASSRAQDCDIARICEENLGLEYGASGKAFVMQAISKSKACPKFSKYSGVVEWANAVVLWVNIGGCDYSNDFANGGRSMMWYGGSRHKGDTPVIQRLVRVGQQSMAEADKKLKSKKETVKKQRDGGAGKMPEQVLLFCRTSIAAKLGKGSGMAPYVFCGRLGYISHRESKHPVRFEWSLLDFDHLIKCDDFKRILDTSGVSEVKQEHNVSAKKAPSMPSMKVGCKKRRKK